MFQAFARRDTIVKAAAEAEAEAGVGSEGKWHKSMDFRAAAQETQENVYKDCRYLVDIGVFILRHAVLPMGTPMGPRRRRMPLFRLASNWKVLWQEVAAKWEEEEEEVKA
jgi:hypothetical protein